MTLSSKRVMELIGKAQDSKKGAGGPGQMEEADFDELKTLSKLASSSFPQPYHDILEKTKFLYQNGEQYQLGQRLKRAIDVADKFGTIQKPQEETALIASFSLKKKEKERVLELYQDLRKIIFASTFFDEPHKVRLLNRTAAIETEVHKDAGLLDVVLAGVVDVGDALGAFGRKVEPLTKRIQEIAGIARKGSKEYDQLPAPDEIKSLPAPDETNEQ